MNTTNSRHTRTAAVAGMFYPAKPDVLRAQVDTALNRCGQNGANFPNPPRAVISPHAGYRYSGMLTAAAISATRGAHIPTVAVLSPSHRHAFDGIALPSADAYQLPGMEVAIDTEARDLLVTKGLAHIEDAAHDREHGIETQLPFLHLLHPGAKVIPLVIGNASVSDVARVVDILAGLRETPPFFVLSSDLSHFLTLDDAHQKDAETARLIETGAFQKLTPAHACGARGVAGYLASQFAKGTRPCRLSMSNSHATSGDAGRTVGYGAWALCGMNDAVFAQRGGDQLLDVARQALTSATSKNGRTPDVKVHSFPHPLRTHAACFVTLNAGDRLRGCIGSLTAHRPLVEDVVINAVKSGFKDPRFKPLQADELDQLSIKIAVLSPAGQMELADQADLERQLDPGKDGLILTDGSHRGTFLPMVWDKLPKPTDFVNALKVKAGLPREHWSGTLRIARFRAETLSETA